MTRIQTEINRRSFLKISTAGGTGLLIGFHWLASCSQKPTKDIPEEWLDINAYIKIANTGRITIFSPNPEIGQNVKTSMPLIVAEELEADWEKVIVEQANLNTVKYDRQLAGGSQSIRHGWSILRLAGATGKLMLMTAAANRWQVPINDVIAEKGILKNKKTGSTLDYGQVALEAASLEVPKEVALKSPEDFRLIGTKVKNVDGPKIVTGKPLFGLDYNREGQTIAMIVHPPAFGMRLKSFDATEALQINGVLDIFTIDTSMANPQWSDTNAFKELLVITGTATWPLIKAKKQLTVAWENDTSLESSEEHFDKLAEAIENEEGTIERQDGNPAHIISSGDRIIEKIYTAPFLAHNTLEPMNFFAHVTPDKAELIGPIQTPEYLRTSASRLLGLAEDNIHIEMTRMGGGFGRRLYGHFALEAAVISKKIGGPVKLIYKREDDMTQGTYRPAYRAKYTATLDSNNVLTSFQCKAGGLPSSPLFANRFPAGAVTHYRAESVGAKTNVSTGAWRAPRSNFIAGAEQSFIDEVAEAAGKDPIDFRLELFNRAITNPVGENNDYDPERYAGVLRLIREKAKWDTKTTGVYRGVSAYYCHNSYIAQVVDVTLENGKPKLQKIWCAVDCGIVVNKEGAINQIEGGMIDGIGHAMYSQMTFRDGVPDQSNFDLYRLIRNTEAPPEIEVFFVENGIDPTGLGEPSLPPVIAALANAAYQATGKRWYHQPYAITGDKVNVG